MLVLACSRPSLVEAPPVAVAGEPYEATLSVEGGKGPVRSRLVEGALPEGLDLNPAGVISGTPLYAGEHSLVLGLQGERGEERLEEVHLEVVWAEDMLPCGASVSGHHDEAGATWLNEPWAAEPLWESQGYSVVRLPVPNADLSRVRVEAEGEVIVLPVPPASPHDLAEALGDYLYPEEGGLELSLLSYPDLETLRALGEPLRLLVASLEPGDWSLSAACEEGPTLIDPWLPAVRVGEPFDLNLSVVTGDFGVQWQLDGLPQWAELGEWGHITGTAPEPGFWPLEVHLTEAEGRTNTVSSGIGVVEIQELACGESLEWAIAAGRDEVGPETDPSTQAWIRIPLDEPISELELQFAGGDAWLEVFPPGDGGDLAPLITTSGWLSLESSMGLYSPAPWVEAGSLVARVELDSRESSPARLLVECDDTTRLDLGFPVLEPGGEGHPQRMAGAEPASWSLVDLPEGVHLDSDGLLRADPDTPPGGSMAYLETVDEEGHTHLDGQELYVGAESPGGGLLPRLDCGQSLQLGNGSLYVVPQDDSLQRMLFTLRNDSLDYCRLELDASYLPGTYVWAYPQSEGHMELRAGELPDLTRHLHRVLFPTVYCYLEDASAEVSLDCW